MGNMLVFAFLLALGLTSAQQYCTTGLSGPIPGKYKIVQLPNLELKPGEPAWQLNYGLPPNCEKGVLQVTVCDVVAPNVEVLTNILAIVVRKGDVSQSTVAQALYYCPYDSAQRGSSKYNKQPVAAAVSLDKVRK